MGIRTAHVIVGCTVSFITGVAVAFVFLMLPRVTTDWIELSKPKDSGSISYSSEAIFKSDIYLPDIEQFGGKAKFVRHTGSSGTYGLGYVINVSVPALDLTKVPEKYLKERVIVIEGAKVMRPSIDQVSYEVDFHFTLMDKDGFTLLEVQSEPHTIRSGKSNVFQGLAKPQVRREVAAGVTTVVVQLGVRKCQTCERE